MNWRESQGFSQDSDSPLLLSHSRNNRGDRLGYDGIYKAVKAIAKIAGVENAHPHRGRHTIATNMILQGLDPMLAMEITRHKSPDSYKRYSKRATQIRAEQAFLQNQNLFKN